MRSKIFSMALGALACLILALPAAAQDGRSAAAGIFQGIYEALSVWLGGTDADLEALDSAQDSDEIGPLIVPVGLQAPGNSAVSAPPSAMFAEPAAPASEIGAITFPGG